MDRFEFVTAPDALPFPETDDPNDKKIGELARWKPGDYQRAKVVLMGYPEDEGVRRNNGRVGARKAPAAIRRELYRLSAPAEFAALNLFDLGDIKPAATLEETHGLQAEVVAQVLKDDKNLIVLGGGNDLSYPDCLGLSRVAESILAFNVDRHFDVRADERCNSGTPYRQLLEAGLVEPARFYEMGSQPFANSPAYEDYLKNCGARIYPLNEWRERGITTLCRNILHRSNAGAIFWGLDLDVVRSADAPGVSAPATTGLTAEEICSVAEIAGYDQRSKILELSEVNPLYDIDSRTAALAAAVIYFYLQGKLSVR